MFDLIPDMACKRAEISPAAAAFTDAETGRIWTFDQVNRAAGSIAAAFSRKGLVEGDRIAVLCLNRVEFFLALFACQKTGIILCPLNWRQPAPELLDTLTPIGAKALLYDHTNTETANMLSKQAGLAAWSFEGDLASWIETDEPVLSAQVPAARPWYLLLTSGTTGRPKAVIQTARMAWANAVNISQAADLDATDSSVNFLPLFHTAGINLYTMPLFLNGAHSTILPKFEPNIIFNLIREGSISKLFGVPAIYQAFSLHADVDQVDWTTIGCGCGGAPLSEPLIRFFSERGANVLNGFGMTETGPTVFLMDPEHAKEKIGSVGKPQMLTEVRLDGLADGQPGVGEIQLRGPNITPGYYQNPEATAGTFTDDGWLKTGDIGKRDDDGYYFIVDRIKDMYISGGENVYPAEVERVLNSHPNVLESAVIGVTDAKWGEVGVAFVTVRPGHELDTVSLRYWCREQLAAYKVPATVHVIDDFPRTAAGKVRKPELREFHDNA